MSNWNIVDILVIDMVVIADIADVADTVEIYSRRCSEEKIFSATSIEDLQKVNKYQLDLRKASLTCAFFPLCC